MNALFLVYLGLVSGGVVALTARYIGRRFTLGVAASLAVWFAYVAVLAQLGIVRDANVRPPGIFLVVAPPITFVTFALVRSPAGARSALAFPVWILLAAQSFRLGVEAFLGGLAGAGLLSPLLTFAGGNVEALVAATAPIAAWFATRGARGARDAVIWNVLGLLSLANVATRAVLTTPGPLHLIQAGVPTTAFGALPFVFIPAFFVPLALALHVLAIRSLRTHLRALAPGADPGRLSAAA